MKQDLCKLLCDNPYPGRGICIGCSDNSEDSIILYFIMGRSENSRNRIFEKTDDGIRTAAFDESKMTDPSLIIYKPVRIMADVAIVTNGDQTDTIWDYMTQDSETYSAFHAALKTREFEPDSPNYTPRISGILENSGAYAISILKTIEGNPDKCLRSFYEYSSPVSGLGHFVSTYETDGDPLPSFSGEPIPVGIENTSDFGAYAQKIWQALNNDNKVSLYARRRSIKTGKTEEVIINKHK